MAGKRGRGRPPGRQAAAQEVVVLDCESPNATVSDDRRSLRQRWELASVLNFLRAFKELIGDELMISAEDIETGLITPNDDLAAVHVALLKGIPPVNKNQMVSDAWVTVVCKKLSTWWSWVAEGENPIKADHGEEIARYKQFDPVTRLLILKALCEVRAIQDDVPRYITDALKNGTPITDFRKERIGGDDNCITYWYDGDQVIGYRLYREITTVMKQKMKSKGYSSQPTADSQWETLATNLEEFQETSDNLASSKNTVEKSVGEIIKNDILPVLEELQKKKERAVKRQQRQALQLNSFLNFNRDGARQSRRERKPVKYTFDEYDKTIEDAIQVSSKNLTTSGSLKDKKQVEDDDDEYDETDDDNSSGGTVQYQKNAKTKIKGFHNGRTSGSTSTDGSDSDAYDSEAKGHAEMKKRLKQRPTTNTDYSDHVSSDTEDESSSETNEEAEMAQDTERDISTSATASDDPQDSANKDDGCYDSSGDDSSDDNDEDGGDDSADDGDDPIDE